MTSKSYIIIPARYGSTRFEGKPFALIQGMSLLQRVWQIAKATQHHDDVFIATDDERIAAHAQSFNAKVIMTSEDCQTGTDRVAQAAQAFARENDILVGLQGDAVLTPPWVIDELIQTMKSQDIPMATPAVKLTSQHLTDFLNHKKISPSSGTTVVMKENGDALYFSKQPIPYLYDTQSPNAALYRHIGLYAYQYGTLKKLQSLPASALEKIEKLEQLRALENNINIKVVTVDYRGRSHGSIDTPKDVEVVENIIINEGELVA